MELYIIRHGQSVNNALMEDQLLRVQDPELTEIGHQQARYVAEYLAGATDLEQIVTHPADSPHREAPQKHNITHLYSSAMHRALQTAQPIAQALGLKTEIWLEIHEHGGIWLERDGVIKGYGGLTRTQITEYFPNYILPETITEEGWWKPEDGLEDITLTYARAMRVVKALKDRATHAQTKDDKVAIVTHGTFMDALLKAFTNNLPGDRYFHWHYNTAITRLDLLENGRLIIRYVNRVTHLPPEVVT